MRKGYLKPLGDNKIQFGNFPVDKQDFHGPHLLCSENKKVLRYMKAVTFSSFFKVNYGSCNITSLQYIKSSSYFDKLFWLRVDDGQ